VLCIAPAAASPGEDARSITSLLAVLLPAILVPCAVVGLVVALGGVARARGHAPWRSKHGSAGADGYTLLDAGPSTGAGGQPLAEGAGSGGGSSRGAMGLGILKAMSRRARAKRMRRSCRPAYVGLPEQSAQQHRWVALWQVGGAGELVVGGAPRPLYCGWPGCGVGVVLRESLKAL
jgi:hypothetical protein